MPAAKDLLEKLGDKFTVGDGCWIWTGALSDGYGTTNEMYGPKGARKSRTIYVHRVMYELLVGPIPKGMQLDHLDHTNDPTCPGGSACLHRRCVRPDHLEAVTQAENIRRGPGNGYAERTHCKYGHEFTPENTRVRSDRRSRGCIACEIARTERRAAERLARG